MSEELVLRLRQRIDTLTDERDRWRDLAERRRVARDKYRERCVNLEGSRNFWKSRAQGGIRARVRRDRAA